MKKILPIFFLAFATTLLCRAQIKFGPIAGVNVSHYKLDAGFLSFSTSSKPGPLVGGIIEMPIKEHFYLQSGAQFVNSGYSLNYFGLRLDATINSIQVPINLLYKPGYEENRKFYVGAGPYLALNPTAKVKITTAGLAAITGIPALDSSANLATGDFGIGAVAGYHFSKHFFAQAHYQKGLANMLLDLPGFSVKNYNYGLTIGYLFWKEKKVVKRKTVSRPINKK